MTGVVREGVYTMNGTILFTRGVFVSGTLIMHEYMCARDRPFVVCACFECIGSTLTDVLFVLKHQFDCNG